MTDVRSVLSFVIPVLNEADRLPSLLGELRQGFPDAELIVVDGGSGDDSVAKAMPMANSVLLSSPGRAQQMNLGAACATGDWLAFLHADTQPLFDQSELEPFLHRDMHWFFCQISLKGSSAGLAMVSASMNKRSTATRVATGDQLLFVKREVFASLNGFAAIPLMEDVDICKRLRSLSSGGVIPLKVASSGRRWDEQGLWRTILRMWALRLAFFLGVSPQRLWQHYYGQGAALSSGAE
ncbi:TIGR04283 family arsenosugar biosynthesis glycosyltransferase [Congregibacter brevis]|uniref:TIGR04283 family arsenosugar biosynthesis glycosyltransferase n=1 Tax=Congregibacter brevis TaxID=3081201 RepID=A0ABZ0I804_9GAMM|nr:TIGR04283 family arsenosugar biosynthesis glycosyltransferase [Congregibacter sp. IMCC45268]